MKIVWLSLTMLGLWGVFSLFNCAGTQKDTSAPSSQDPGRERSQYQQAQSTDQEGVYIGILSFADQITDLTNGNLIYLTEEGRGDLFNMLAHYTRAPGSGTSLYYAVHKALADLSNNASAFPQNLSSINVLIFTDGLDNNSTSLALSMIEDQDFRGKSTESYKEYIKEQIQTRLIADTNITSFATGVMGNDVEDRGGFSAALESLANNPNKHSSDRNFYELNNFTELNQKFQEIADSLTVINRNLTFTVITPSYQPGTKIRMTFDVMDNSLQAFSRSARYVEGEVGINGSNYELTNITYSQGVSSSTGTAIQGTLQGTEVSYVFSDFLVSNAKWENIKQWSLDPGTSKWQRNSEYTIGDSLKIVMENKSTVIYLVLDCSRSLADNDINSIKSAVETFINVLYLKLYPDAAGSSGDQTIGALQNSIWKEDQIASGQFRYYRFHAKPGEYFIRWNDSQEGDGTKTCDILVTIYREDTGESLYFEKDAGYQDPPKISIPTETDILIEVKGYNAGQGTYSLMYYQQLMR